MQVKIRHLLLVSILTTAWFALSAQDLDVHWSQHYHAPFHVNPALTGVFSGDKRFSGNYRNQWYSVPVRYETVAIAYDQKFYNSRIRRGLFGGGIQMYSDQAGSSNLRTIQLALSGSYTHQLSGTFFLTGGVQGSFSNRSFDRSGLTFDSQYTGDFFDPSLDPGEAFLNTRYNYPSLASGINLHHQGSKRTWFDLGGGWFHMNRPGQRFNESKVYRTNPRFTAQFNGSLRTGGRIDLLGRALGMFQGKNMEALAGMGMRFHLSEAPTRELALQIGADYRFTQNDAIAPMVGLDFRQWRAAFSWDINLSPFRVATDRIGGPELSIQYIITTVKPLGIIKACPVY